MKDIQRATGRIRVIPKEYRTRCSRCGKEVDIRWNYCPKCREKLHSSEERQPFCSNTVTEPQSGQ